MTSRIDSNTRLVYSSEQGKLCTTCGKPIKACVCRQAKAVMPKDGVVRVGRETKGRKGKGVCLITGVPLGEEELKKLGKQLKQKCGTGGTVKNGVIEIQGDHRDTLIDELKKFGWTVKRSGG
jgi:translation initiation factor 1